MRRIVQSVGLALLAVVFISSVATASSITYVTPTGSTSGDGQSVDASATLVTGAGTLTITLRDLLTAPDVVTASQNISDLFFVLSTGQTTGTLTGSSSDSETVKGNGTSVDDGVIATGWALDNNVNGGLRIHVLGTAVGPAQTIIGGSAGDVYTNANGSLAGNGPHNPFLVGPATFTLSIPGVTADTTITSATFSFGTTEGDNVPGVGCAPTAPECNSVLATPEPASLALFGTGLSLLGVRLRKRKVTA